MFGTSPVKIPHLSFYFLRHGETDLNKASIIMGSMDEPLNDLGRQQAKQASTHLEHAPFQRILCSPRKRALQTAEALSEAKPLMIIEDLSERCWGEAEGKSYHEFPHLFDEAYTPTGGESMEEFKTRILKCLNDNLQLHDLIVSHGGVFRALCLILNIHPIACWNAVPYHFQAPLEKTHPWSVSAIGLPL